MANQFEQRDRRVIPNWRAFATTARLGELNFSKIQTEKDFTVYDISEYLKSWNLNKTIPFAGDLLSAFRSNGSQINESVIEAAQFVIKNKEKAPPVLLSFSESILQPKKTESDIAIPESDANSEKLIIKQLKKRITIFPSNPINYVELARCYSSIANTEKAIRAMKIALSLCPENRFILRAAVRFFVHIGQPDFIHNLLRKSDIVKDDPWVLSSEIALSTLLGKTSSLIKKAKNLISLGSFSPFNLTELNSSLATVEFFSGNIKKTRKFVQASLIAPNDNSLAQAEWLNSKNKILELDFQKFNVPNDFEAIALYNYSKENWAEAIKYANYWFYDIPYSKQPLLLSSHIASSIINEPALSAVILKKGLIAHPTDPTIINNLAYSLALDNHIKDASEYISLVKNKTDISKNTKICITATCGLIEFRKGNYEAGRKYYLEAIESAKSVDNPYFHWVSTLNLAREELLINSSDSFKIIEAITKIPDNSGIPAVNSLKNQILNIFKKKKIN